MVMERMTLQVYWTVIQMLLTLVSTVLVQVGVQD